MEHQLPVAVVCRVLDAPRSTVYARRVRTDPPVRPGPATSISDPDLLGLIRQVLVASPFAGEGYRKVRARLRREHQVQVSGKRVLRLLRQEGLWHPSGSGAAASLVPMTARSFLTAPNQRWGTDATMAWTRSRRLGVGVRLHGPLTAEAWRTWPRSVIASPPCSRSMTPWLTAGAGWMPTSPAACQLRHDWGPQYARATSRARSPGWASPTTPRSLVSRRPTGAPSAGSAPSKSSACGRTARHHRPATPSRGRLRRPLQHLVADPATRPRDPQGGLSGSTSTSSGMIKLTRHLSKKPGVRCF